MALKESIVKRVERLEPVFGVGRPEDDWIDVIMWDIPGGIFGHSHFRFCKSTGEIVRVPCSDEEESEVMRTLYEDEGHRLFGQGSEVSFAEYLERHSYLCPKELVERLQLLVEKIRSEENGAVG